VSLCPIPSVRGVRETDADVAVVGLRLLEISRNALGRFLRAVRLHDRGPLDGRLKDAELVERARAGFDRRLEVGEIVLVERRRRVEAAHLDRREQALLQVRRARSRIGEIVLADDLRPELYVYLLQQTGRQLLEARPSIDDLIGAVAVRSIRPPERELDVIRGRHQRPVVRRVVHVLRIELR